MNWVLLVVGIISVAAVAAVTGVSIYLSHVCITAIEEMTQLARATMEAGRVIAPAKKAEPPPPDMAWKLEQERKHELGLISEMEGRNNG